MKQEEQRGDAPMICYSDWKEHVTFNDGGPSPTALMDTDRLKVVLVGVKAGLMLPHHPTNEAVYHFLSGTGTMTVGDATYHVGRGTTVVVEPDVHRGINAETDIVFLGIRAMKPGD